MKSIALMEHAIKLAISFAWWVQALSAVRVVIKYFPSAARWIVCAMVTVYAFLGCFQCSRWFFHLCSDVKFRQVCELNCGAIAFFRPESQGNQDAHVIFGPWLLAIASPGVVVYRLPC